MIKIDSIDQLKVGDIIQFKVNDERDIAFLTEEYFIYLSHEKRKAWNQIEVYFLNEKRIIKQPINNFNTSWFIYKV